MPAWHTWEEGASIEKLPPPDWPAGMLWLILKDNVLKIWFNEGSHAALLLMLKYISTLRRIIHGTANAVPAEAWVAFSFTASVCCGCQHCSVGAPGASAVVNTHHMGSFSVCYNWMKSRVALVREAFPMEGTAASVNAWRHTRSVRSGKYWIVWDRVSYSTGWPPTCYMAEASLDYPIFTTQGLGLQVCLSKPGRKYSLVPRVGVTPQS